jgi:hypothetical protein
MVPVKLTDIAAIQRIVDDYVAKTPALPFALAASFAAKRQADADASVEALCMVVAEDTTPCNSFPDAPPNTTSWPLKTLVDEFRRTVRSRTEDAMMEAFVTRMKAAEGSDEDKKKAVGRALSHTADVLVGRAILHAIAAAPSSMVKSRELAGLQPPTAAEPVVGPREETVVGSSGAAVSQPPKSPHPASGDEDSALAHPLPEDGLWEKCNDDARFYFCREQNLFYFPLAGHFYDSGSSQWYVPTKEMWLDEHEHDKLMAELFPSES